MFISFYALRYNKIEDQYPETVKIAYPKAGTPVSSVNLWVYDTEKEDLIGPIDEPDFDG